MRLDRPAVFLFVPLLVLLVGAAACGPFGPGQARVTTPPPPAPKIEPLPPITPVPPEGGCAMASVREIIRRSSVSPEIDAVIEQAGLHFQRGKSFAAQGDAASARREFDAAVDVLLEAPDVAKDRRRAEQKCAELVEKIYSYDVEKLGASNREPGYDASPLDEIMAATFPVDPNIDLDVTEELRLPVSQLPLEVNGEVMRYINYFSSPRGRKTLIKGLRHSGRYQAMIQRIFEEEGIPPELIRLAQAESGFLPKARSRKRALGLWQFMRLRAREYGLKRTSYYDDRLDPEKATRAAARHLRDLYEQLGDWYLAIAAYNCGPGRIDRAVRRTGYADFWELSKRRVLPRQTRNYVPIILAMIIMTKSPEKYGLDKVELDPPIEYTTIEMTAKTHLGLIADVLGKPLAEIQALNPAIRKNIAPAGYTVHVPKGTGSFVMAALRTVPASRRASWRVHRVGYGETLSEIAKLYKTTPDRIAVANGGALLTPEAGDLVVVPVSYSSRRRTSRSRSRKTRNKSSTSSRSRRVVLEEHSPAG